MRLKQIEFIGDKYKIWLLCIYYKFSLLVLLHKSDLFHLCLTDKYESH